MANKAEKIYYVGDPQVDSMLDGPYTKAQAIKVARRWVDEIVDYEPVLILVAVGEVKRPEKPVPEVRWFGDR